MKTALLKFGGITLAIFIGSLSANVVSYLIFEEYLEYQAEKLAEKINEEAEKQKDQDRANLVARLRRERLQKEWNEYYKKENSNECKFWKHQNRSNPKAAEKIRQYCWNGPLPEKIN